MRAIKVMLWGMLFVLIGIEGLVSNELIIAAVFGGFGLSLMIGGSVVSIEETSEETTKVNEQIKNEDG